MVLISNGLPAGTGLFVPSGSWTLGQSPQKSQYDSDENRCSSLGAGVGHRWGNIALGESVLEAVTCHSHFLVSCTMNFKLGAILPTPKMV